jgi:hypothetical protein
MTDPNTMKASQSAILRRARLPLIRQSARAFQNSAPQHRLAAPVLTATQGGLGSHHHRP